MHVGHNNLYYMVRITVLSHFNISRELHRLYTLQIVPQLMCVVQQVVDLVRKNDTQLVSIFSSVILYSKIQPSGNQMTCFAAQIKKKKKQRPTVAAAVSEQKGNYATKSKAL